LRLWAQRNAHFDEVQDIALDVDGPPAKPLLAEGDVTARGTGFSRGGDHFDPDKDVILRVEAMRHVEHKVGLNYRKRRDIWHG
jgi:hypothetical protein